MDCRDVEDAKRERALRNRRNRHRRTSEFTLESLIGANLDLESKEFGQSAPDFFKAEGTDEEISGPPVLPPHLLQVLKNMF